MKVQRVIFIKIETKRFGRVKIKNKYKKTLKKVKIYLLKVSGASGYQIRKGEKNKKALITKNIKSFRKVLNQREKIKKTLRERQEHIGMLIKIKIYRRWSKIKKSESGRKTWFGRADNL